MGILKQLFGLESHNDDVARELAGNLNEAMKLMKLSGVTEEEVKELRGRLVDLGFRIKLLVAQEVKLPEKLVHDVEALEKNLGLELKRMISEEEIIKHDLTSALSNLRNALRLVSSLEEKKRITPSLENKKEGKKKKKAA